MKNIVVLTGARIKKFISCFFNGSNLANFENSIQNLCDYLNPYLQEKVSSIKRKITDAVGSNMAKYYIIDKDDSDQKYKIKLDRKSVEFI